MELGIQIADTYERVVEVAQWAEEKGLACVSLPDHYLYDPPPYTDPAPDALTQIAGLARESRQIELATLVSPVTFRHPAVFAKTAITLDRMSGGRFTLGLGAGWMRAEHEIFGIPFPSLATRFELLEEHLAYLRSAFTPGDRGYAGRNVSLQPIDIQPPASHRPRLLVGGFGATRTPRLAGTYADEFNVRGKSIKEMADRIARAEAASASVGRLPGDLKVSTACIPLIGATESDLRETLDEGAEMYGIPRAEIESQWAAEGQLIGTLDHIADTLGQWKEIGITRFYVQRITVKRSLSEASDLVDLIAAAAGGEFKPTDSAHHGVA